MFSPVYVILPFSDVPPAQAIRASLAHFERGGRGDVPDEWLAFHDETERVQALHGANLTFSEADGGGLQIQGTEDVWPLDIDTVRTAMKARDLRSWQVRLTEIEPDLDAFVARFIRGLERHPISGGYGRWLNPLGRWDWWDLGGRFDGRIAGERRRPGRTASLVSSGPNRGREVLASVEDALGLNLGAEPAREIVVGSDANVELVSRLIEDARADQAHAFPGAILLPPGSCEDRLRWIRSWPDVGPQDSLAMLGLPADAPWREVVRAAYERHPDHWAANVAIHL